MCRDFADEDLMRRTQRGDQKAFAHLYQRYNDRIVTYLERAMGCRGDVEAVAQETFYRALRAAHTYRYPQKFSGWVFTIARNLASNHLRRYRRGLIRNITDIAPTPESYQAFDAPCWEADSAEREESTLQAVDALAQLASPRREAVTLAVMHDMPYAQIEELTGIRAVTLRTHVFQGLREMRGRLVAQ